VAGQHHRHGEQQAPPETPSEHPDVIEMTRMSIVARMVGLSNRVVARITRLAIARFVADVSVRVSGVVVVGRHRAIHRDPLLLCRATFVDRISIRAGAVTRLLPERRTRMHRGSDASSL